MKLQIWHGKLSGYKVGKILHHFIVDVEASKTAQLVGINRKTVDSYYGLFRQLIFKKQTKEFEKLDGTIELDESYFGARRLRGKHQKLKRGRGTYKQPVFGIYQRDGRVYTEIIPNCSKKVLQDIIKGVVSRNTEINSDGWTGYDGLVNVGYDKHHRVNHSKDEFSDFKGHHINGIENFWSFTKRRLQQFNGIRKTHFALFLKECEWRYNRDKAELETELKYMLNKYIKQQQKLRKKGLA